MQKHPTVLLYSQKFRSSEQSEAVHGVSVSVVRVIKVMMLCGNRQSLSMGIKAPNLCIFNCTPGLQSLSSAVA